MTSEPRHVFGVRGSWYLAHVLAVLSVLVLGFMVFMNLYFSSTRDLPEIPPAIRPLGSLSAIAMIWLWIWMLTDYFRQRPARSPVLWGWLLFLGSVFGGLAYFFAVWRPRNKAHDT
jgi:drug/metabolite transporter (DMT)-like permease